MPMYVFKCQNCDEVVTKQMSVEELIEFKSHPYCNKCGGEMKQLFSTMNFILKGKGWYKDNYEKTPSG